MADGPDYKTIGVAAKDVLMGIVGVVAGAEAGAPGAQAANTANSGLDKLIGMADSSGGSRADRADRADKPKKPTTPKGTAPVVATPMASGPPPASAEEVASSKRGGPPPASPQEVASSQPTGGAAEWPPTGEARVTADHLSELGYSRGRIQQILNGPNDSTLAQVTQVGKPPKDVEGTRLAPVPAQATKRHNATSVPIVPADRVASVDGLAAVNAQTIKTHASAAVPIVAGRRIEPNKGSPETA